jgi:hypothetical protein
VSATVDERSESGGLSAGIELRSADPPAGDVRLVNRATEPVRLFRPGNSWGDEALSFELTRGGTTARLVRRPQVYSRDVPAWVLVPPGGNQTRPFDFGDGSWEVRDSDQLDGPGTTLVVVYGVRDSPEARANGVWTGHLRSAPVSLESAP